jgi:glutaredoxin 3
LRENHVVVFVKSKCPYSQQVEDLLENDEVDAYIVNMDEVSDKRGVKEALNERSNNSMVPKIFINGRYIGMLSQLKEWEANGRLFRETGTARPSYDCDAAGGCPYDG